MEVIRLKKEIIALGIRITLGGRRRLETDLAISSCTAKISSSTRSYVSDHRWNPSDAFTNCVVIRTRLPALRTLPSSSVLTPSFCPMVRKSSFLPLNAKHDVRPVTLSPGFLARTFSSSSVRPSEKYSFSGSALMFVKGRTAIDGVSCLESLVAAGAGLSRQRRRASASSVQVA
jgi:hypothetical protein